MGASWSLYQRWEQMQQIQAKCAEVYGTVVWGAGCAAGQRPSAGRLRSLINDAPPTGDRETE